MAALEWLVAPRIVARQVASVNPGADRVVTPDPGCFHPSAGNVVSAARRARCRLGEYHALKNALAELVELPMIRRGSVSGKLPV
jgi:hypothetical protein